MHELLHMIGGRRAAAGGRADGLHAFAIGLRLDPLKPPAWWRNGSSCWRFWGPG